MTAIATGFKSLTSSRDEEGYRHYSADVMVETDDIDDGPGIVMFAPGLAPTGSTWSNGNDSDPWAFCSPERTVRRAPDYPEGDPVTHWIVTQKFSNKPRKRCQSTEIEDPLSEPYKISGSCNKQTEERIADKDGVPLLYNTFERIRGPLVERSRALPVTNIEANVAAIPQGNYLGMVERVNSGVFWGYAARHVRLVDAAYSRQLYGVCFFYYTVSYAFEFKEDGYDEPILNEGRKSLKDGGSLTNPKDFILHKDLAGEHAGPVPIGADGKIITNLAASHYLNKQIDKEADFLLLPGVPASI